MAARAIEAQMLGVAKVRSVDAARTTTVAAFAGTQVLGAWERELGGRAEKANARHADAFDERAARAEGGDAHPNLGKGARISVYWTEMDEWYEATHLSTRKVRDENGETVHESHVQYDAVGEWKTTTKYWHRLADEEWETI